MEALPTHFTNAIDTNVGDSVKQWNVKALKFEVEHQCQRIGKKIGRLNEKLLKDQSEYQQIMSTSDSLPTELEKCRNLEIVQNEIDALRSKYSDLTDLKDMLSSIQSVNNPSFPAALKIIEKWNITDELPVHRASKLKNATEVSQPKAKAPKPAPRKPYHIYRSSDGIEIYVGRGASDNDQLSCDPAHRDDDEWWLHVSEYAGSHVVIKSNDDYLASRYPQTVLDAAVLAAANSKASGAGKVTVHLTRCGNVSKPANAKPGLVHLHGDIKPISINLKSESRRLKNLEKIG